MPSCSLSVRLDGSDVFRAGDEIAGSVIVTTDEPAECRRLEVRPVLELRSRAGSPTLEGPAVQVFSGPLPAGETACPFRLTAPKGPFEHLGQHLSISWLLVASAEVAGAKKLEDRMHIKLEAPDQYDRSVRADPPPPKADKDKDEGSYVPAYVIFGGLLLASVGTTVHGVVTGEIGEIVGGIIGTVVLSVFVYAIRLAGKDDVAKKKLDRLIGRPRLTVAQRRRGGYREGEEKSVLDCTVEVKPSAPPLIVRAALMVEERVVVISGGEHTRSEPFSEILHGANDQLTQAEPGIYRGALPFAPGSDVPCSIGNDRAGILWTVEATVSQAGKGWSRRTATKLDVKPA